MATVAENSCSGGIFIGTIPTPASAITVDDQPCRSCLVRHFSGTATFVDIQKVADPATAWPLGTLIHSIPVRNLNQLSFIGTAGDKVQIMWRA